MSDAPRQRDFSQVDVFTATPLLGNPLAVVHDGSGLSTERMQAFARWTNLSETTFLLPPTNPEADYRVRIFTPGGELPFAGFVMLELQRQMTRVGDRHDCIERETGAQHLVEHERLDDRRRIGEPAGLDHHPVKRMARRQEVAERRDEVAADLAADAAVVDLDHGFRGRQRELSVDARLAELVDDHRDAAGTGF